MELQRFDGATWITFAVSADVHFAAGGIEALGIATGADATNRLPIAAPASLFTHEGSVHQRKVNKAAAGDTASLLFQTDEETDELFRLAETIASAPPPAGAHASGDPVVVGLWYRQDDVVEIEGDIPT